jgi:prepilin-type N-terminal cleavage/methylation domain-containing protein
MKLNRQKGFTLIEVAIVLLIVAILLGYTVALFPVQQELKQYRQADTEMDGIVDALIGFAQVNGRLPCPDTDTNGRENALDVWDIVNNSAAPSPADTFIDSCTAYTGLVPMTTLGLQGNADSNNNLLDPWGGLYQYSVSDVDTDLGNVIDLVSPNGIRAEGVGQVKPDLKICNGAGAAIDVCPGADITAQDLNTVAEGIAVVLVSTGKNRNNIVSAIQTENTDGDKAFVSATRSDASSAEYDDVVKWISTSRLFSKMIEADQLP